MLVSLKEVSKYVDISSLTPEEIAQRLTFSGIEVEEIKHLSEATNLVIGEVLTCVAHPDSDHLHCCKVNIGTEILDIVCGAPNCRAGLKVIVAKAGAKLPHGEIKKGMIRGQESNGMLCALNELGVDPKYLKEEQIKGIEELPSDAKVGETNVLEYLGLDDTILDLNLLANRSDCYSLYNVAKEIGALFNRKVTIPEEKDFGTFDADFKVGSLTEKCKQFSSKVIKGIKIKESPKFLKEVLRSQGIRSIDNIVDIGNYAMLLTGQPIHMYDYDKLMKNELIVKDDYEGEVVALDDKSYQIQKGDLVVTSNGEAVAIAGVMGLANVEIDENTKNIVVEVANFDHASIRRTSSRLGLTSDSSQRYVKGINPNQYNEVLYLIARLCKEYADAQEVSKNINYDTLNHDKKVIKSSYKYINNRLGTNFTNEVIKNTLTSLHFEFKDLKDGEFEVTVPPYRIDVDGQADLSEEVVRYNGFNNVVSSLPNMETTVGGLKDEERKERAIEDFLLEEGFDETLSYTLINKKDYSLFNYINNEEGYVVFNPLTEDRKYVRRNILTSVLRCAEYNLNRKNSNFKIFEISRVQTKKSYDEHLAFVLVGKTYERSKLNGRDYNFFDAKGILETILKMFNIQESRVKYSRIESGNEFHPGRSAKVMLDGKLLAVFGELHPSIKSEFSLTKSDTLICFEMNLSLLFKTRTGQNKFSDISKFPSVSRDYAFVIEETIPYQDIKREIKKASNLIKDINIFDIYKGEHIEKGHISIAINIVLESLDHTLKDEEINAVDKKIRDIITIKFRGEIRK